MTRGTSKWGRSTVPCADSLADAANLRLAPHRSQIYLLAVTNDQMLKSGMAALGTPGPGSTKGLIEIFLHGALRAEHG
jgi:hypothetical protein